MKPMRSLFFVTLSSLYLMGCYNNVGTTASSTQTPAPSSTPAASQTWTPTALPTFTPTPIARSVFDLLPTAFHKTTVMRLFWVLQAGINGTHVEVVVDPMLGNVTFSFAWQGAEADTLTLSLKQPDGTILDVSMQENEDFSYRNDSRHIEYAIDDPQTGTWTLMFFSEYPVDIPYEIEVYSTEDQMQSVLLFEDEEEWGGELHYDEKDYQPGDCIKLTAWAQEEKQYVDGAYVGMIAQDPLGAEYDFHLFDDGLHGDLKAGDGIHAGDFCHTQITGTYLFYAQIAGGANRDENAGGEMVFTRELVRSTTVH